MAKEPKTVIEIPELNRPNIHGKGTDLARLELNTYGNNGRIWSHASVVFLQPDGSITFEYRKALPAVRARATQKTLDTHHANTFTEHNVCLITGDVLAFYRAKQKEEEPEQSPEDAMDDFNYVGSRHHY
jgi:hypothetical protein